MGSSLLRGFHSPCRTIDCRLLGHRKSRRGPRRDFRFPSISKEAALLLLERNVAGIGIDTLSPDRPDSGFPVHEIMLSHGKSIIENVANAKAMPPMGGFSLAMPIKTEGGTEAPIRLIGLI